jgi:hypothetical protein
MKKFLILLIVIFCSTFVWGIDFYPYINCTTGVDTITNVNQLKDCYKRGDLLFHDFWYSVGWNPIILEIEWLAYDQMPKLPGDYITRSDTWWAASNAIDSWNEVPANGDMFREYISGYDNNRIQIWVFDDLQNYPNLGSTADFCGITCYCINPHDEYSLNSTSKCN